MKLVIILKLPSQLVRRMNVYRKKYHPSGISHLPAHITLVPAFDLKDKLENLYKDLGKVIKGQKPFFLELNGIGNFARHIFFKLNHPPQLKKIHSVLKHLVEKNYRKEKTKEYRGFKKYIPHMTIAKVLPRQISYYKKILKQFAPKKIHCKINGIEIWQENLWIRKKTLLFSKK